MPDMLARLYDLPDARPSLERTSAGGFLIRRAEPWDRERMRSFATDGPEIGGFAVYECTRRGFFGPTGVREDLRGHGIGAALLFRCLHSMREMGYAYAVIGGVGPVEFYEKVCGAFAIPESEVGVYGPLFELRAAEPA